MDGWLDERMGWMDGWMGWMENLMWHDWFDVLTV